MSLSAGALVPDAEALRQSAFRVIPDIPGRPASSHFTASVRSPGGGWRQAYVLQSSSRNASGPAGCGYFAHLNGWSQSWLSFELLGDDGSVEVRVQRSSSPISRAVVRPPSTSARVLGVDADGARILVSGAARFHVDVDGGLEETDTGPDYLGPPMHTFAVFAEPPEPSPPRRGDAGVVWVSAGERIPTAAELPANTTTLAFGPGVHRLPSSSSPQRRRSTGNSWAVYMLPPNGVRVHLALGCVLHGALATDAAAKRRGTPQGRVWVGGYGVLSGEEQRRGAHVGARHLSRDSPHAGCDDDGRGGNLSPQGISIDGATHVHLSGVTLVDHPNHHLIASVAQHSCTGDDGDDGDDGSEDHDSDGRVRGGVGMVHNVKVLGWRANGDGLHVFGPAWRVSDLFLRVQDDALYTHTTSAPPSPPPPQPSLGTPRGGGGTATAACSHPPSEFERIATWNDANGAAFVVAGSGSILRDSDVLYARASWAWWAGGRVFSQRRMGATTDVLLSDVRVLDPLPTLNAFQIDEGDEPPRLEDTAAASTATTTAVAAAAVVASAAHATAVMARGGSHEPPPPRSFHDVTFANITIANLSTVRECPAHGHGCNCVPACPEGALPAGIPNLLRGGGGGDSSTARPAGAAVRSGNNITRVRFINVRIAGLGLQDLSRVAPGWLNVSGAVSDLTVDGAPFSPL